MQCKRAIELVKRIIDETDDKVVVVSQWTTFLSIVAEFLHREKVHYVELNGKTPIKDRNNIVVSFNKPESPERVCLIFDIRDSVHRAHLSESILIFVFFFQSGYDAFVSGWRSWFEFNRCKSFDFT